jgi:hypothetical protein
MEIDEYARKRLEQSATRAKEFWRGVKNRFSREFSDGEASFRVLDIQQISDDCIDLVMVRSDKGIEYDQMDHWRFVVEKRLFRKPKIRTYFTSGPALKEFMSND